MQTPFLSPSRWELVSFPDLLQATSRGGGLGTRLVGNRARPGNESGAASLPVLP